MIKMNDNIKSRNRIKCEKMKEGANMINVNKLKGKIVEKGMTVKTLAREIGVDQSTLYRKLKNNGDDITIKEANLIMKSLNLTIEEVNIIFFTPNVA